MINRYSLVLVEVRVVTRMVASTTRTGRPRTRASQEPSGRRLTGASFIARLPVLARIRKSAPAAATRSKIL